MRPGVRQPSGPWRGSIEYPKPRPGLDELTASIIGPGPWQPATDAQRQALADHLAGRLILGQGGRIDT